MTKKIKKKSTAPQLLWNPFENHYENLMISNLQGSKESMPQNMWGDRQLTKDTITHPKEHIFKDP